MRSETFILSVVLSLGAPSFAQAEASCEISMGPVQLAQARELNDAAKRGHGPVTRATIDQRRPVSRVPSAPVR